MCGGSASSSRSRSSVITRCTEAVSSCEVGVSDRRYPLRFLHDAHGAAAEDGVFVEPLEAGVLQARAQGVVVLRRQGIGRLAVRELRERAFDQAVERLALAEDVEP